jgi:hypothetical protein
MGTLLAVATTFLVGSWFPIAGGTWSPDQVTVSHMRMALQPFVAAQAVKQARHLQLWSSYSFQYQGRSTTGGQFVFINAFCSAPDAYSAKQFLRVLDGNTCYFDVKYNPKTKMFYDFGFHGVA